MFVYYCTIHAEFLKSVGLPLHACKVTFRRKEERKNFQLHLVLNVKRFFGKETMGTYFIQLLSLSRYNAVVLRWGWYRKEVTLVNTVISIHHHKMTQPYGTLAFQTRTSHNFYNKSDNVLGCKIIRMT